MSPPVPTLRSEMDETFAYRLTDFRAATDGSIRLSSKRFHALLNSLFKVLFNFPSRYLFAIGLVVVFSFRRGLPSTLSCTLKQLDSTEAQTERTSLRYRPRTFFGVPFKGAYEANVSTDRLSLTLQVLKAVG
jgi:hypothetical protein